MCRFVARQASVSAVQLLGQISLRSPGFLIVGGTSEVCFVNESIPLHATITYPILCITQTRTCPQVHDLSLSLYLSLKALAMLSRMRPDGLEPDTISYSAAISACEKSGIPYMYMRSCIHIDLVIRIPLALSLPRKINKHVTMQYTDVRQPGVVSECTTR